MTASVVLVTDPRFGLAHTSDVIRWAAASLGPGQLLVQLRDKESEEAVVLETAHALRDVTRGANALFVVNGPAALARVVGADGVHLPLRARAPSVQSALAMRVAEARSLLGDAALVTTTAHDDDDVRVAAQSGATAALVSPIFTTPGKGPARGVAAIEAARAIVDASRRAPPLLVYALGGVTPKNAGACREVGADGVAVIRALLDAGPSEGAVRAAALALAPTAVAGRRDEC